MRPRSAPSVERTEPEHHAVRSASEMRGVKKYECDSCSGEFEGEPAGSGLFIWSRGDEVRYEEPPLCQECASKITLGALMSFGDDEEEEG
jgi:hypothetical protein